MPIYEYQCSKCGEFEVMQRISDKPLRTCPTCRRKVTKLISNTSFQLKGSGWYITDYARKGKTADDKADAKAETKSESTSESKSDAKTDTSTESKSSSTKADKSTKSTKAKGAKGAKSAA